jgi:hypothetical protein
VHQLTFQNVVQEPTIEKTSELPNPLDDVSFTNSDHDANPDSGNIPEVSLGNISDKAIG